MRVPILLAMLVALAPVWLAGRGGPPPPVSATPVPLDPADPARTHIGRLTFTGGWVLASRDRRFGGLSALAALGPGRLLALSDSAQPVLIAFGPRGPLARLLPVLDTAADPMSGKAGYDTESLARDPVSGTLWAGLERRNVILRYTPGLGLAGRRAPPAMRRWPPNHGAEAMARLADGRLLVIAETVGRGPGTREALLFPADPTAQGAVAPTLLAYRPPPGGYDPSDAAALPDGRVLVLNRRLGPTGFSAILTIVDPRGAGPGAVLEGAPAATLARPLTVDNLEGVAVSRERDGLIVWLVSDDNFLPFQRTLLLRFRLTP